MLYGLDRNVLKLKDIIISRSTEPRRCDVPPGAEREGSVAKRIKVSRRSHVAFTNGLPRKLPRIDTKPEPRADQARGSEHWGSTARHVVRITSTGSIDCAKLTLVIKHSFAFKSDTSVSGALY